ncbi:hypothetical protein CBM2585_A90008 [Cupriavidus taiwanensis]|nr:hypothetical protein CBM2585_A90008 [Cupriavidus taiwanensis]
MPGSHGVAPENFGGIAGKTEQEQNQAKYNQSGWLRGSRSAPRRRSICSPQYQLLFLAMPLSGGGDRIEWVAWALGRPVRDALCERA